MSKIIKVSYTKEVRALALAKRKGLFTIAVTYPGKGNAFGMSVQYCGPLTLEECEKIMNFLGQFIDGGLTGDDDGDNTDEGLAGREG
jgi:hypothetical protein